jgi:general secretion pathway protein K
MRTVRHGQQGMALILTIMIVSLIVVVTVQFGLGMRREYFSSANQKDSAIADSIAFSGVNIAMEILAWDGKINGYDSSHDVWNKISTRNLSPLFDDGTLHLAISELSGRLQVNSLVDEKQGRQGPGPANAQRSREILQRLLLSGRFGDIQEDEAQEIVDSLVDWIDSDSRALPFGAENDYYRSLDPPYDCKNGPVAFMEELLLVKGMTRKILYGTKDHKGLASYLTVHGDDGRININTADPVLLEEIDPRMTEELAKEMVAFRSREQNELKLSSHAWYKEISFWPSNLTFDDTLITTKSSYFIITSVGVSGALSRQDKAYVHREQNDRITLLSNKVE